MSIFFTRRSFNPKVFVATIYPARQIPIPGKHILDAVQKIGTLGAEPKFAAFVKEPK